MSLFITDAPSDDFDAINMTVTKIELLGGSTGPATVFEGLETFDLLALRDVSELFASAEDVPAGLYSKIRLTLSDLELVEDDGQGGYESHHPHLPGNGKVDLLTEEPIEIREGEMAMMQLDIDADRSIHIVETGNGRRYNFRPVVFVEILKNAFSGKLARLHGTMRNIDADAGRFDLCRVRRPLPWVAHLRRHPATDAELQQARLAGAGGGEIVEEVDEEEIERHLPTLRCVAVTMLDDGAIFDENGEPIRLGNVEEGQRATAVGHIERVRDELSDRPILRLHLLAQLVLLGERGTFTSLRGAVDSELDDRDQFDLLLAPGQGYAEGSVMNVQLFPTTRIFSRSGVEISRDQIEPGRRASATGVIVVSSEDPAFIRTALLILQVDPPDAGKLRGEITRIALAARVMAVETSEGSVEAVCVPERAALFLITEGGSHSERIEFEDLELGDIADVYGRPTDECFIAHVVIAFPPGEDPDGGEEGSGE